MRSLRNRRSGFGYFLGEGLRSVFIHKFMSFAAVTIIAACLLITATFTLVAYNLDLKIKDMGRLSEIIVYIDESLTEDEARLVGTKISKLENVDKIVFVTKEELLEEFIKESGDDAYFLEDLNENNPLRHSVRVTMKDISLHAETVEALMKISGVASNNSEKAVSDMLIQVRRVVNLVCFTLIAMLGAVSVFIISNTVKLAMFNRREEISIMKMVGATNHFIRAPFIVEGMTLGLLAAIIAFFAQWGVYHYITKELQAGTAILEMVPFSGFSTMLALILAGVGLVVGAAGSTLTIRRFLKV